MEDRLWTEEERQNYAEEMLRKFIIGTLFLSNLCLLGGTSIK
ncbi:hypothetical protein [Euhalothece natronophila]|nr:hypothetical protein [Euhalothece natronophila]